MFGNNAFGALAMDSSPSNAGPSNQVVEGDEVDVSWLKLIKRNQGVDVRVSENINLEGLPDECSLMAVVNTWGLVVVGGNTDVRIHRLADIHRLINEAPGGNKTLPESAPVQTISLPARPVWVKSVMKDEYLIVATANGAGVFVWKLRDAMAGNTSPLHSFTSNIPTTLLDVLPNPSADQLGRLVALVAKEGLVMADIEEGKLMPPVVGPFTCAGWSAKGKQIVVGKPDGQLTQYTPDGTPKSDIPSPPGLNSHASFVQWLENDVFLVTYVQNVESMDSDPIEQYVIHRQKPSFTFTKFYDPLNGMGYPSRSEAFRHFAGLGAWGAESKHLAFIISGAATDIAVMNGRPDKGGKWEVLFLDGPERGTMPVANPKMGRDNTSTLGLAFDFTSKDTVQQSTDGTLPDLAPLPRLLAYSQEGVIISFDVRNPDAGSYPGMITARDISSASAPAEDAMDTGGEPSPAPTSTPSAPKPASFGSASGSIAFGQSAFGTSKPGALGASAFGASSKPSTFGASPAFGQTSAPGTATGSSSPSAAFGQSAFGSSAKLSAFGTSAFGASGVSAFGQSSAPTGSTGSSNAASPASAFGAAKPAFGGFGQKSSQPTAFGQSGFGSSTAPSVFGQSSSPSAFGGKSAFGQPAFGQTNQPASPAPSAFGTSTTPSAFGQTGKPASAASPAFRASSPSAFGQSNKLASPAPSAFGTSTSTTPAFAGFGPKPAVGGSNFGFGQSAFGQKPEGEKKEGSTAFGRSTFGGDNGIGGSAFGTSAFGQKPVPSSSPAPSTEVSKPPALAGFGQPKAEAFKSSPSPAPTANAEKDDFGLGGFASALATSKPTSVPGLEESPPSSPVMGVGKKPAGLDDETPPNSPPAKPAAATPKSVATPGAPSSTTPSFFKPATAFGNTAPSFGFGQAAEKKIGATAFGSSFAPAAGTPGSATPSSGPSAFGAPAFGKPSAIGGSTTSSPAFGQPSKPTGSAFGFGQSSAPTAPVNVAATKPIGNISGGFGGFASASSKEPAKGFSAFASGGSSVFGDGQPAFGSKPASSSPFGNASSAASPFGSKAGSTFGTKPPPSDEKKVGEAKASDVPELILAKSAAPSFAEVVKEGTENEMKEEEVKGFDVPEPIAQKENAPSFAEITKESIEEKEEDKSEVPEPLTSKENAPSFAEVTKENAQEKDEDTKEHEIPPPISEVEGAPSFAHVASHAPECTTPTKEPVKTTVEAAQILTPRGSSTRSKTDPAGLKEDADTEKLSEKEKTEDAAKTEREQTEAEKEGPHEEKAVTKKHYEIPNQQQIEGEQSTSSTADAKAATPQAEPVIEEPPSVEPSPTESEAEVVEQGKEEAASGEDLGDEELYDEEEREEEKAHGEDGYDGEPHEQEHYDEEDEYDEDQYDGEEQYDEEEEQYDEEEEQYDEVDEYDEEGEQRNRSPSFSSDISPVNEQSEDSDGKIDHEDVERDEEGNAVSEKAESSAKKSPPAWFTKPASTPTPPADKEPTSSTPTSEGASFFSRLSFAPSTTEQPKSSLEPPKLPFPFKHAAKTSSPLSGPPLGQSTTPESSPAKPAATSAFGSLDQKPAEARKTDTDKTKTPVPPGGFSLFGQKPPGRDKPSAAAISLFGQKPAEAAEPAKQEPSIVAFGHFGQPKIEPIKPLASTEFTKPTGTAGSSVFGQKPAETGKSLFSTQPLAVPSTPSAITAPVAARTVPEENAPKLTGLGLGKPSAPSGPSSLSSIKPAANPQTPFFTPMAAGPATPSTPATPARAPALNKPKIADFSDVTAPTRPDVPERPAKAAAIEKGPMGTVAVKVIEQLDDEVQRLKDALAANAEYHQQLRTRNAGIVEFHALVNLVEQQGVIPFSQIFQIQRLIDELYPRVTKQRDSDAMAERKLADLRSKMSRMDMKIGQVEKLIKARRDSSFSETARLMDLDPEQAAYQAKLRKATQDAEGQIEQLENLLAGLKRRVERQEHRQNPSQPPLERIQRSVRNIDAAIRERQQTIDELSRRVASLRVSPRKILLSQSVARGPINFEPTKEIIAEIEASMASTEAKKNRLEKIKVARLTKLSVPRGGEDGGTVKRGSFTHEFVANGPIIINEIPLPGKLSPPPSPATESLP
ncbi:nucleoporin family protein [Cryptococcus neoformans C23]|uniref:Nucleoporin family protein n=1 Tax=Cryptococcus neoformans (strain H99 / ATCC 208821 / CBS 10515 / FGSC 9487) TaxID=235443 RepID=J9VVV2_CRYN9|nr:nucleoporin family protein [Cryptococcus neoformans var. grubii H99]AFR95835.2 nucleoporin family protein [Cryptococcus neoformans var. grubii H99]AUB25692.1 nucleoporin family protein [Cryptococcus neoformans var. grubii]OWZ42906.1 nucleoporin family protein [Cryptococcus neoformans var. grubii C23]|eukprot:XP_012050271.1 nucleoporin family protein [Cryptococcus neoformans var. grubii H99]